ncbi:MAG: class II fructose-bisphosphatase [Sphingobacteriia bacterium]|nr:class II fructose-bisphosphatase [Sphingobacteriia bacterium]
MILSNILYALNPDHNKKLEKLIYDAVFITESAAMACMPLIGLGNEKLADQAAVNAMRDAMNKTPFSGKIVIGEGERDEAPMLFIGEEVGCGDGPSVDIAVDPLEGTTLCAHAAPNSLAVLAIGEEGTLLNAPDVYMDKIAVGGCNLPNDLISLDNTPEQNLKEVAKAKKCSVSDLGVMILNRPRHQELITKVRSTGARVHLISDGDIAASIFTTDPSTNIDVYMGIGGAPEGVLAASALKVCGGQFVGRLIAMSDEEKSRVAKMGITDINKQYNINELVKSDCLFVATGVTDGILLKGVKKYNTHYLTNTLVMHYATKTVRNITNKILVNSNNES